MGGREGQRKREGRGRACEREGKVRRGEAERSSSKRSARVKEANRNQCVDASSAFRFLLECKDLEPISSLCGAAGGERASRHPEALAQKERQGLEKNDLEPPPLSNAQRGSTRARCNTRFLDPHLVPGARHVARCDAGGTRTLIRGESSAGGSVQMFWQAVGRNGGGRRASLSPLRCVRACFGFLGGG